MFKRSPFSIVAYVFAGCGCLLLCCRAAAANLTVDNTHDSTVSATSNEDGTSSTPITGQGIFTATSGDNDPDMSSATATITDAANTLSLTQSLVEQVILTAQPNTAVGFTETGSEDLFFKVATNTAFDMTGTYTAQIVEVFASPDVPPSGTSAQLSASLFDVTTGTSIFNDFNAGAAGVPITLGPETGTLTAGDLYEFMASGGMTTNPVTADPNGSGSITFAMTPGMQPIGGSVPVPAAVWTGGIALLAAAIAKKKLAPAA